jgi:hypothetical protein
MKALKIVIVLLVLYVAVVVLFESLLGYFQPEAGTTMTISTFEQDGAAHDRVVARLEVDGQLYVAVNHWPRAWYRRMLRNPVVRISYDNTAGDYRAVQLAGADYDRVNSRHGLPFVFRLLTGFPPRHLFRLEPI